MRKRQGPITSSTLSPKIHNDHMFPMMWAQPPCRNMQVRNGQ